MRRLFLLAVAVTIVVPLLVVVVTMAALAAADCGDGTPTAVTVPSGSVRTMAEMVGYLESQSIPAIDAAGIVGNLMQESGLNPMERGYGLAQWSPGWWASASAWIGAQGQNPNSAGGQLMYIAANVNEGVDASRFYPGLRSDLHRATSAQEAALVWMNDYEQCSGAGPRGSLSFTPGSLCMAQQREGYALQALRAVGGTGSAVGTLLTASTPDGSCNASFQPTGSIRGYTDPLQAATGIAWERTDQGVDAAMAPGSPLLAFAPSIVRMIVSDFYAGQPAIVFEATGGPLAGKWWYLSEEITPTVSQGQAIGAGQTVATYASAGTGIEIGWWAPGGGYPLGHPGYEEGLATNAGGDFRHLLRALGANPGSGAGLSTGPTMGNADYPTANPGP
jgi:Phage tail lysozyme